MCGTKREGAVKRGRLKGNKKLLDAPRLADKGTSDTVGCEESAAFQAASRFGGIV